jgi:hypothetical protein
MSMSKSHDSLNMNMKMVENNIIIKVRHTLQMEENLFDKNTIDILLSTKI